MPAYLDNNATTRPDPSVIEAMTRAMREDWANPSSVHRAGQSARRIVELARSSVAKLINAEAREVTFTSGATESIDLAIRGVLDASPPERDVIVTTSIEHEAVRDLCKDLESSGIEVRTLALDDRGVVIAESLRDLLDARVALVSVQWANNETGAIQPIEALSEICREHRVPLHSDATQWVGKLPTDVRTTPVDLLSFSAHKMHGPKGVGALWVSRRVRLRAQLLGTQERERRGGTENVPGIVGFGVAAEHALERLADEHLRAQIESLRDKFERGVLERVPDAVVNGPTGSGARLPNTTNIGFPSFEAEALLLMLSERGVQASAGAACSSGSLDPSPVLLAMGVPETIAHGSLRFSLSHETTDQDVRDAIEAVTECVGRLRGVGSPTA
ncbi:MAG: cysteine desulfurase family protein [Planctomycetota bacterium]